MMEEETVSFYSRVSKPVMKRIDELTKESGLPKAAVIELIIIRGLGIEKPEPAGIQKLNEMLGGE